MVKYTNESATAPKSKKFLDRMIYAGGRMSVFNKQRRCSGGGHSQN